MWGSGSQSPFDFGSQSQGGPYGLSQESGFGFGSQQSEWLTQTPTQYSQSQSQLSQPSIPECTECHSTEIHTTDDGDMVGWRSGEVVVKRWVIPTESERARETHGQTEFDAMY